MSVLADKWQVVRNTNGAPAKSKKSAANGSATAVFKPVPLAPNTYENLEAEHGSDSDDDFRYQIGNGKLAAKVNGNGKLAANGKAGNKKGKPVPPSPPRDLIPIDFSKLSGSLAICRTKFPSNDLLILQEVANFIRMDADFSGAIKLSSSVDEFSFPLKHLSPRQLSELRSIVSSIEDENAFWRFIEYAIEEMTNAFSRGDNLLSHRLCLQLISLEKPESFLHIAEKYAGIIKNSRNTPHKLQAIMSAFAQAGQGSLSVGLNVWYIVMFPTIQLPNLTNVTLQYGERLLNAYNILNDLQLPPSSAPQQLRPAFDLLMSSLQKLQPYNPSPNSDLFAHDVAITPHNFFRLFDMVYPVNAQTGKLTQPAYLQRMTPAQKRQIATICFKVKVLLMKYGSDSTPATMFPSFLVRYHESLPVFVKKEMLANLLVCLHCDQAGVSQAWIGTCKRYPENAGLLLSSVNENLSFFADFVPNISLLKKTMKTVESSLESTGNSSNGGKSRGFFGRLFGSIFWLVRTAFIILTLFVLADLFMAHCDFPATRTAKYLKKYDLYRPLQRQINAMTDQFVKFSKIVYPYVSEMYAKFSPWAVSASETFVKYYEPFSKSIAPYKKAFLKHAGQFYAYAADYAGKANVWLIANGIDFESGLKWLVNTAIPIAGQFAYDKGVVAWAYFETSILPTLEKAGNEIYVLAVKYGGEARVLLVKYGNDGWVVARKYGYEAWVIIQKYSEDLNWWIQKQVAQYTK